MIADFDDGLTSGAESESNFRNNNLRNRHLVNGNGRQQPQQVVNGRRAQQQQQQQRGPSPPTSKRRAAASNQQMQNSRASSSPPPPSQNINKRSQQAGGKAGGGNNKFSAKVDSIFSEVTSYEMGSGSGSGDSGKRRPPNTASPLRRSVDDPLPTPPPPPPPPAPPPATNGEVVVPTSKSVKDQVSSLEARGRKEQLSEAEKKRRRSKSENPLQRKLSVAQHLSMTTKPVVRNKEKSPPPPPMPEKTKIHLKAAGAGGRSAGSSFERNSTSRQPAIKPVRVDSQRRGVGSFDRYPRASPSARNPNVSLAHHKQRQMHSPSGSNTGSGSGGARSVASGVSSNPYESVTGGGAPPSDSTARPSRGRGQQREEAKKVYSRSKSVGAIEAAEWEMPVQRGSGGEGRRNGNRRSQNRSPDRRGGAGGQRPNVGSGGGGLGSGGGRSKGRGRSFDRGAGPSILQSPPSPNHIKEMKQQQQRALRLEQQMQQSR